MNNVSETTLNDHPKYRQYVYTVEKVLKSFDTSSDWTDLISALGKLNKVLNSKFKMIPKKITIGKRLAQCMHPALPGGVHLKALEVYNTIFDILEKEHLKSDLYIYTVGIFPLFANASMQVRPVLLQLYETHFLSLNENLSCCIDGLLLGLLPGLEEGAEHFNQIDHLLESISEKIGEIEFYGALWRCVLTSHAIRLFAVQLVLRRFDKKKSTDDQLFIIGPNVDIMVTALSEAIQDDCALTQRSSLDILVLCFPLSDIPVSREDACNLLYSALHCILRRDMSLNRRLYSWLLGYDLSKADVDISYLSTDEKNTYFFDFASGLLVKAFHQIIVNQIKKIECDFSLAIKLSIVEELYPIRIFVNLLDKPEIGYAIVDELLIDTLRLLKVVVDITIKKSFSSESCQNQKEKNSQMLQIAKITSLLFTTFEPNFLWQYFSSLIESHTKKSTCVSCSSDEYHISLSEIYNYIKIFLDIENMESFLENSQLSLPKLLNDVVQSIANSISFLTVEETTSGLTICKKLLDLSHCLSHTKFSTPMAGMKFDLLQEVPFSSFDEVGKSSHLVQNLLTNFIQFHFHVTRVEIETFVEKLEVLNFKQISGLQLMHYEENFTSGTTELYNVESVDAFQVLCQLLVDFASIPFCCHGEKLSSLNDIYPFLINDGLLGFPFWLRSFLWIICGNLMKPPSACFRIVFAALTALLDLMALVESCPHHCGFNNADSISKITSVFVLPPLTPSNILTLNNKTIFFHLITKKIWKILDNFSISEHHLAAVQLLIHLHSVCPDNRCEDVLLEDIIHSNKDIRIKALSKFCSMWHFTRILMAKKCFLHGIQIKEFKRCLFAVFDVLTVSTISPKTMLSPFDADNNGCAVIASIATSWLLHCMEEGDLIRVLEPLLSVALHPQSHSSPISLSDVAAKLTKLIKNDKKCTYETSKRDGYNFMKNIAVDIINGKQSYNELVACLTTLPLMYPQDQILKIQASKLVDDIINTSIIFVKKSSGNHQNNQDELQTKLQDGKTIGVHDVFSYEEETSNICKDPNFNLSIQKSKVDKIDHMLLYQEKVDAAQCLYALQSIHTFLEYHPKLFTHASVTTLLNPDGLKFTSHLPELITRHLHSMSNGFFYGELPQRSKNKMVFDALLVICLRSIQSWHINHSSEILHDLRCSAISLLAKLFNQLGILLGETGFTFCNLVSPKSFTSQQLSPFVHSILIKYDLTKVILSCLESSVIALKSYDNADGLSFNDEFPLHNSKPCRSDLFSLNAENLAFWWCGNSLPRVKSFQHHLIKLIHHLFVVEHHLSFNALFKTQSSNNLNESRLHFPLQLSENSFLNLQLMILQLTIRTLRLQCCSDVHVIWLDLIIFALPYMNATLTEVVLSVTSQICRNLENTTNIYSLNTSDDEASFLNYIPVDYVITLLKSLHGFFNFCLFLQNSPGSSLITKNLSPSNVGASNSSSGSTVPFFALGSLFSVFGGTSTNSSKMQRSIDEQGLPDSWIGGRRALLKNLPRIMTCLAIITERVMTQHKSKVQFKKKRLCNVNIDPCITMGDNEVVLQDILQILNPLSLQYGENFMSALAIIWEKKGRSSTRNIESLTSKEFLSEQQIQVLNLSFQIQCLQCNVILDLIRKIIVHPPELPLLISIKKRKIVFEERLLHFLLVFIQEQTPSNLGNSWSSMLCLARECLTKIPDFSISSINIDSQLRNDVSISNRTLTPRCYFLLLLVITEFVKRASLFDDKKQQKELQDICVKCIEICNSIVDRSLEHGGWLGRRLPYVMVALDLSTSYPQVDAELPNQTSEFSSKEESQSMHSDDSSQRSTGHPRLESAVIKKNSNTQYCNTVQAFTVMSKVMANLLDIVFGSEEKEKTLPVFTSVMTNTMPFLRTHNYKTAPSFCAATALISSVSSYQHARKSWKKDVYELFLAPEFFQMPFNSVSDWANIIDHLMTHDAITFKEFLARLSIIRSSTPGSSLNIFSSKEQEMEQRAMLLKRLAFVVFSSSSNQYQRFLPEIQERLSESIKFHQAPLVQEKVFLCFRVLLLRISPTHLTSLWPSIITELVQVFGLIEEELVEVTDIDNSGHKLSSRKNKSSVLSTWAFGLTSARVTNHERWMALYLSACKLLDLALSLQDKQLPHFKMFRWSFVGESDYHTESLSNNNTSSLPADNDQLRDSSFIPHCLRIKQLLDLKNPNGCNDLISVVPMRLLIDAKHLVELEQLHPFFNTIVSPNSMLKHGRYNETKKWSHYSNSEIEMERSHIEKHLWKDFIEDLS